MNDDEDAGQWIRLRPEENAKLALLRVQLDAKKAEIAAHLAAGYTASGGVAPTAEALREEVDELLENWELADVETGNLRASSPLQELLAQAINICSEMVGFLEGAKERDD